MKKRLTAAFLCLCLLFTLIPATAFAEETPDSGTPPAQSTLCEHHPQHDESCGYTEGAAEIPCSHEHTDDCYTLVTACVHVHTAACYPAQSASQQTAAASAPEDAASAAEESASAPEDAAPAVCTHTCSEESGCITKTLACQHEHDEACGYAPAVAESPCTFVCEICHAPDGGDAAASSDAQPEACTCEIHCTADTIYSACPICSAEGAELDKVCAG